MSNRATLKTFFETNDFPSQVEFVDWLNSTPLWTKTTILFSDFQPNATTYNQISLFLGAAGTTPQAAKIKHSIPFTGGSTASSVIKVNDGSGNEILSDSDVFREAGDTVGIIQNIATLSAIPDQNLPSDYAVTLTIDGDIIDNLVAGACDIWILENPVV